MNEQRSAHPAGLPAIRGHQLVVDDQSAILLGGQLHNSVPSSPTHNAEAVDHVAGLHAGLVIGSASWSQVEPAEGVFDFASVDAQLDHARAHGLRMILIWFGAFKNAASTYAPRWVRSDPQRFPRAVTGERSDIAWTYAGQTPKPVLSVFSSQLRAADKRAFCALTQHLADHDPEHTVVMLQVENEVGLLGDSRDRSAPALTAWDAEVPAALVEQLSTPSGLPMTPLAELWSKNGRPTEGAWSEVFGDGPAVDEAFMAWAFADYCNDLARAAKAIKPLPMFVNAWLGPQPGQPLPGDYPSGGPTVNVLDVWKIAAPSLDLLAPDIYVEDVKPVLAAYARDDNPLFIPEARFRTGNLFYALGHHRAVGFSVFGIDDGRRDSQLARAYRLLVPLQAQIASAQQEGRIEGVLLEKGQPEKIALGGYVLTVRGTRELVGQLMLDAGVQGPPEPAPMPSETREGTIPEPGDDRSFGLVIWEGDDTFLIVGQGLTVDFAQAGADVEVDHVEELLVRDGALSVGRVLNGDERLFVVPIDEIGAARVRLLSLPAATTTRSEEL